MLVGANDAAAAAAVAGLRHGARRAQRIQVAVRGAELALELPALLLLLLQQLCRLGRAVEQRRGGLQFGRELLVQLARLAELLQRASSGGTGQTRALSAI
jgi:hypothetical protein